MKRPLNRKVIGVVTFRTYSSRRQLVRQHTHLHLEHVIRISTQASQDVSRDAHVDLVPFVRTHGRQEPVHRGGGRGDDGRSH